MTQISVFLFYNSPKSILSKFMLMNYNYFIICNTYLHVNDVIYSGALSNKTTSKKLSVFEICADTKRDSSKISGALTVGVDGHVIQTLLA